MFVVEKTNKLLKNREVTYINLWNKPSNEIKSILYSFQIKPKELSGYLSDGIYKIIKDGDKEVGAYYKVKQHDLEENWLSPCVFANPNLNKFIVDLKTIVKLEYFSKYVLNNGIDIKQVKTAFSESATITPYRIVWGQQSSMKSIFLDNNFIGYGRIKSRNAIRLHNDNSSTFMISERPHLNNDTLIAFETQVNSLATAFWEIKLKNNFNDCMPLFILWFNSTFGLLLYLSISTNSMGEIFKTKKGQLEFLKSPNLKEYSDDIILKAKQLYDQIKTDDFQSFPEEFLLASQEKGLRKQIDDFFIKELNLDIDLGPYYAMLANEPILTLKRL